MMTWEVHEYNEGKRIMHKKGGIKDLQGKEGRERNTGKREGRERNTVKGNRENSGPGEKWK